MFLDVEIYTLGVISFFEGCDCIRYLICMRRKSKTEEKLPWN